MLFFNFAFQYKNIIIFFMKSKFLLFIALVLGGIVAQEKNNHLLHVGLIGGDTPNFGGALQYHYRAHEQFSVGANVGLGFTGRGNLFVFTFKPAVQFDYHFAQLAKLPNEWDLYAGVQGGIVLNAVAGATGVTGHGGIRAGMRYFVTPSMGIQTEISGGYLSNGMQAGIVWKL